MNQLYRIGIAEFATGIVLNPDGQWASGEPRRLTFQDLDEAIEFARKHVVENPDRECYVLDSTDKVLALFRPPFPPDPPLTSGPPTPHFRKWWQFW